jgi:hypothetical protein
MDPDLFGVLSRLAAEHRGADLAPPLFTPEWNGQHVTTAFRRPTNGESSPMTSTMISLYGSP